MPFSKIKEKINKYQQKPKNYEVITQKAVNFEEIDKKKQKEEERYKYWNNLFYKLKLNVPKDYSTKFGKLISYLFGEVVLELMEIYIYGILINISAHYIFNLPIGIFSIVHQGRFFALGIPLFLFIRLIDHVYKRKGEVAIKGRN